MERLLSLIPSISRHTQLPFVWLALFTLFLIFPSGSLLSFQQQKMKIVVEGDTSHTISLSSFDEGRLTYASLDDLAAGLGVRTFWNEETKKLELKLKNHRIKFTADNPFVVITDLAASAANVRQLPASVASHGGKLYAPMVLLFPLFNAVSEKHISILSPTEPVSTVPSVTPSPFDITDLSIEPKLNG